MPISSNTIPFILLGKFFNNSLKLLIPSLSNIRLIYIKPSSFIYFISKQGIPTQKSLTGKRKVILLSWHLFFKVSTISLLVTNTRLLFFIIFFHTY